MLSQVFVYDQNIQLDFKDGLYKFCQNLVARFLRAAYNCIHVFVCIQNVQFNFDFDDL